jgi:hypothetical protein
MSFIKLLSLCFKTVLRQEREKEHNRGGLTKHGHYSTEYKFPTSCWQGDLGMNFTANFASLGSRASL